MKARMLCVMGTRPEVIKMAPVVQALRNRGLEAPILVTAQHRELLDQMLKVFNLEPDWDLDLMRPGQDPATLTGALVPALSRALRDVRPTVVLAQGDTSTVLCTALAAYYEGLPFAHVEAGLRSGDLAAPFPEEGNRRVAATFARWHFAPTETAKAALLREGHPEARIKVVGNTGIDALLAVAAREDLPRPGLPPLEDGERLILATLHRRETFGAPLEDLCLALRTFILDHPDARLLFPVHPNPNVQGPVHALLGGQDRIHLVPPLGYPSLVKALQRAYLVVTDSGGLQEEGPALGKPVLVCRDSTERPEVVAAGGACLVGRAPARLLAEAARLWDDPGAYAAMAQPRFPYGTGAAGAAIAAILDGEL